MYTEDLMVLDSCRPPPSAVGLPGSMQLVTTPLIWQEWDRGLARHPDQQFCRYIVDGIRYGFRLGFNYSQVHRSATRNMVSADQQPQVVQDYLATECAAGRILGPLSPEHVQGVHISRFGVIPKKTPGKWRLILDLSHPEGGSVNTGIAEQHCSLHYVSTEDAARAIAHKDRGCKLAKVDIQNAYRTVPVHPDDRRLLGMMWEGSLFIDTVLPFGLRSAPKVFTAIADAAEWILHEEGMEVVLHYLDDFLLVGSPSSQQCEQALATLFGVFECLGPPQRSSKARQRSSLFWAWS